MENTDQPLKKLRAACVERVSTPGQEEARTIEAQITTTEEYCRRKGYEIVGHYRDDGWSGDLSARPATDSLIADAQAGLFDIAVCASVNRMSRGSEFYWNTVPAIRRAGVKVEYVETPTLTEADVLMENVLVGVAADEKLRIARRFAEGKRQKVAIRKLFMGHIPPFGFRYFRDKNDKNDPGRIEHHERNAEIIKKIFEWVGHENVSANEAIRRLAHMKISSPRGNPAWTKATFLAMLKNEAYLGKFYYYRHESIIPKKYRKEKKYRRNPKTGHRIRPQDQWVLVELPDMRLVSDSTFELVQEALKRNRMFSKRNTKRQVLLGGGLIVCEACNGTYYAGSVHGRDIYKCGDKLRRFPFPQTCDAEIKSVSAPRIEASVWNLVCKILKDPDFLMAQLEKNRDLFQKERIGVLRDLELAEAQVAEKEAEERRLVSAVQKGVLSDGQIAEASKRLSADKVYLINHRKGLQERLKEVEISENARNDIKLICAQAGSVLDDLTFEEKQEVVRLVIKKIYCNGKRVRVRFNLPLGRGGENGSKIPVNPIEPEAIVDKRIIANNRLRSTLRRLTQKRRGHVMILRSRSATCARADNYRHSTNVR
jgi:site-specific DNA recombinase